MKTKIIEFLYRSFILVLIASLVAVPMEFFTNIPMWLVMFSRFSCTFWIGIAVLMMVVFTFELSILVFNILKHIWSFLKFYSKHGD